MTASDENTSRADDDAVERLLGRADPRPVPPAEDERIVREAVRAEWLAVTGRRQTRRRTLGFGVAATVLIAAAFTFSALRAPAPARVEVATLDKSRGTVVLQDDRTGRRTDAGGSGSTILAVQSLTTGRDAGAGLRWGQGGSLRVDEDTRIEFVSAGEIVLHSGRVYFDSASPGARNGLSIRTPHGTVAHVGTQYMTATDDDGLVVSVREGEVRIDGRYYDQTAYGGQQVELAGSSRPSVANISGAGPEWQWVESVAPAFEGDGKSAHEFLQWVGRETGRRVEFASPGAEALARGNRLFGTLEGDPREELRLWMMTVDLEAEFAADRAALIVRTTE